MSIPFGLYGRYYDLLYQDKDYVAEAVYVSQLIRRFSPSAHTLLELGCGSCKHAVQLQRDDWEVTGVERSEPMIALARDRNRSLDIVTGDARTIRLERKFDAVASLFHVFSYQVDNQDVSAVLQTAAIHLNAGGLFLFDVWYGPAVLAQLPEPRIKEMEDDRISVCRRAQPEIDTANHVVHVRYNIKVTDKATGQQETFSEDHQMRYFDFDEIQRFATAAGMTVIHHEEWLTGAKPSAETWGVNFVLKKDDESC